MASKAKKINRTMKRATRARKAGMTKTANRLSKKAQRQRMRNVKR